jgi:hypothetical protein
MTKETGTHEPFEWMWTTHKHEYVLVRLSTGSLMPYNIKTYTAFVVEDNETYAYIKQKLEEAGIPIVGPRDVKNRKQR